MFFILSKLLAFLIHPLFWGAVLFVAAVLTEKPLRRRRLLIAATMVLLVFSDPFLLMQFAKRWDIKPVPLKRSGTYSCVIILGGFSSEGPNGTGYFNNSADRFIQGLKLYTGGRATHILITGGNAALLGGGFKEGDWVTAQLKDFNVPDTAILNENASRNTIENAAFSGRLLQSKKLKGPYILVTSAFHMRRALKIFQKAGIDVIPYPCNYFLGTRATTVDAFVPDLDTFDNWNIYLREVTGYLVNFLKR